MIPLPNGDNMTYERWSSAVVEEFALDIPQGVPWREFSDRIILSLPQYDLPQQRGFTDWLPWAERCMNEFFG